MFDRKWNESDVEQELRAYRGMACEVKLLQLEIGSMEEVTACKEESIEAAVLRTPGNLVSAGGAADSDYTARLAVGLPDAEALLTARAAYRAVERRKARVEAWVDGLPYKTKFVIRMTYFEGYNMMETLHQFNRNPSDGMPRDERTLRRWKREGIQKIVEMANLRSV